MENELDGVVRSKGYFWLATSGIRRFMVTGWWHCAPGAGGMGGRVCRKERWPEMLSHWKFIMSNWIDGIW